MFQVDAVKVLAATAAQQKGEANSKAKKLIEDNKAKYENFEARYKALNDRINKRGDNTPYKEPMPLELEEAAASEEAAKDESASEDKTAETAAEQKTKIASSRLLSMGEREMEMKKIKLETALIDAKFLVRQTDLKDAERQLRIAGFKDRACHVLGEESRTFSATKLIGELVKEMRALEMLRGEGESTSSGLVSMALEIDGATWNAHSKAMPVVGGRDLSLGEMKRLGQAMTESSGNSLKEKPYATPWQPRAWMKPWVFIPRYLEVNHKICAAVYLRHPVARKGQAEVPTPFHYFSNQLAHAWYVTKGVSKYKHKPNQ